MKPTAASSYGRPLTRGSMRRRRTRPDGSTLVWDHEAADASENGLYLMRASDGGAVRRLTVAPQDAARLVIDVDPQFSPDGRRVAFSRFRLADHGTVSAVLIVDVTDPTCARSRRGARPARPLDWSPDGQRLVYETETWHFPGRRAPRTSWS